MSRLESLANELLLDLFEYLDDVHLFRAFHGLNSRFDDLLCEHSRNYHLDFRSISKKDFDSICRQYLPSIHDRVLSIHLSDDDDTPQLCKFFLLFTSSVYQFNNLRSLSQSYIDIDYEIIRIINQLTHLTHINICQCRYIDMNHLVNSIWSLPKLTHCNLDKVIRYGSFSSVPTILSSSLEHLSIHGDSCSFNELARLFHYTPRLRYLSMSIWDFYTTEQFPSAILSINILKLLFQGPSHVITNLLQNMANLSNLTMKTERVILDGYQWEQIIESYLPNLKIFRFLMQFSLCHNHDQEEQIDEFLNSFRTDFWLKKHRWFVRCHWNSNSQNRLISLYTLPYAFGYFLHQNNIRFRSTCPDDGNHWSYDCVQSLFCEGSMSKDLSLVPARFPRIRNLHIELPFNDHFWFIIPILDRLISLNVSRYNNAKAQFQLQSLLDRAPCLYSLTFSSLFTSKLLELKSKSIHRLNLQEWNHWFNERQCRTLIRSLLGNQCEVLLIQVKKRANVLQLVKKMTRLRALIFRCQDDQGCITERDELIEWLEDHLPATHSITRSTDKLSIRIWIHQ